MPRGEILPKGKASTTAKIVQCMKEEFMTFGYEKASLNRVSAKVGITTAGFLPEAKPGRIKIYKFLAA